MIPLCIPQIGDNEINAVIEVLKSGWLVHGPKNEEFEKAFAEYIGTRFAVSMNSCTSALFMAFKAMDIRGEVILPSFTFAASANAVVTAGARPVFVDIDYDTCTMDPRAAESAVTSGTEAIMPVHFGGQTADMGAVMALAQKHHLAVIEDSAETIGGTFLGRQAGSFGVGCFSFFPTKNITTGEGGMLTTGDPNLAQRARTLIAHGMAKSPRGRKQADSSVATCGRTLRDDPRPTGTGPYTTGTGPCTTGTGPCTTTPSENLPQWYREAVEAGYNFRMPNILAAMGVEQMKRIDEFNQLRRGRAALLTELLSEDERIDLPVEAKGRKHVYQMYTIKVPGKDRDRIVAGLNRLGVGASVHFAPPVHRQKFYAENFPVGRDLPVTDAVAAAILTLPMFPSLTEDQARTIAVSLKQVLDSM